MFEGTGTITGFEMLGAGEDFLANGLKTFFLSFLPKRAPLDLSMAVVPLVSGLRLELLD